MTRFDRTCIHALFFCSGFAALVYQVVWVRYLALILGASSQAVALVLAAFMAGLALGGAALGRAAERMRSPLRIFGLLELGVAAVALLMPLALGAVQGLYLAGARELETATQSLGAARAVLAFGTLLAPTFLMGGTLPVLVAAVVRRPGDLHQGLSSLYATNTAGAALGALATGFVLLPALGTRGAELAGVFVNLTVAAAALGLARSRSARQPRSGAVVSDGALSPTPAAGDALALRLVFWGTAVCGFGALALEVLWTRAIAMVIGSSVYSFSIMLAAFLVGIALGSAIHGRWRRRSHEGWQLVSLLAGIAVATLAATLALPHLPVLALHVSQGLDDGLVGHRPWSAAVLCFSVLLVPCVLHGMAFPLAGEAWARLRRRTARSTGDLVSLNTLGSIAGSLAAGFLLVPALGLQRSLFAISALYASYAIGLAVTLRALRSPSPRALLATTAAAAIALLWAGALAIPPDTAVLAGFRNNSLEEARRTLAGRAPQSASVLYYREGTGSTVSVVEEPGGVRRLQVDGKSVASDAASDLRHELLLGHLPVLLHPAPRSALVVGLGAGITLGGVTAHPEFDSITQVEIEPAVVPAARLFGHVHRDALDDPRVDLVLRDGRNFLLTTSRRFDVITSDPIHPWARGAAYLYTREYYQMARARMREGGVMCQWLPLYELSPEDLRSAVGSFVDVFPHATLWSTRYDALMIGSTQPLRVDLGDWQQRLSSPAVRAGLGRIGLASPLSLLAELALDADGVRRLAGDAPRNTDDDVRLEFSTPLQVGRADRLVALNRRLIESHAGDAFGIVDGVEPGFADREAARRAFARVLRARSALWQALAAGEPAARVERLRDVKRQAPGYGRIDLLLARELQLVGREALARGAADPAIAALREAAALAPQDWRPQVLLGRALQAAGDLAAAAAVLRAAVEQWPHASPAHYELAGVLIASDGRREALAHLRRAALARPGWSEPRNDLAWLLATETGLERGAREEAVTWAESAVRLSGARDPATLDTLAVAYAAAGRREEAQRVMARALVLARESAPSLVGTLERRRAAFERGDFGAAGQ